MKYIEVWGNTEKISLLSHVCRENDVPNYLAAVKNCGQKHTHIIIYEYESLHKPETITLDKRIEA